MCHRKNPHKSIFSQISWSFVKGLQACSDLSVRLFGTVIYCLAGVIWRQKADVITILGRVLEGGRQISELTLVMAAGFASTVPGSIHVVVDKDRRDGLAKKLLQYTHTVGVSLSLWHQFDDALLWQPWVNTAAGNAKRRDEGRGESMQNWFNQSKCCHANLTLFIWK